MAKSPPIPKWRIAYSNGGIKVTIGHIEAPDEHVAIVKAIVKFNIGPGLVGKVIAERTKTHPQRKR